MLTFNGLYFIQLFLITILINILYHSLSFCIYLTSNCIFKYELNMFVIIFGMNILKI